MTSILTLMSGMGIDTMIIKYIWCTSHYDKHYRKLHERTWKGWFLFGFIPLYVTTVEYLIKG